MINSLMRKTCYNFIWKFVRTVDRCYLPCFSLLTYTIIFSMESCRVFVDAFRFDKIYVDTIRPGTLSVTQSTTLAILLIYSGVKLINTYDHGSNQLTQINFVLILWLRPVSMWYQYLSILLWENVVLDGRSRCCLDRYHILI